jgi:Arc/MetJ-type ribon-helix-helix transcriptional regulator
MRASTRYHSGFDLPKMTSGKPADSSPKPNSKPTLVKFASTEADQRLLRAVDHLLETGSYASFSDLCKAALRLMLFSPSVAPSGSSSDQSLEELRQQVQQLAERLTQLEAKLGEPPAEDPVPAVDPLLSRLAPLLEDF